MQEKIIYLNNAVTSFPKPDSVALLIEKALSNPVPESQRGTYSGDLDYIHETRKIICSFFGFDHPNKAIFTSSATESLNTIIQGISSVLKKPHFIASYKEHNSVLRPLFHLLRERKIELTLIKPDKEGWLDPQKIENAIRNNTIAVILSHLSNCVGDVSDLDTIGKICYSRNLQFIVDAAQSCGLIPINIKKSNINFLVFTGHKSLFGITGIGGFVLNSDIKIKPLKYGGTGIKSESLYQPEELPIYYESGTQNFIGIISLFAGIKFIQETGLNNIYDRVKYLTKYLHDKLKEMDSIKILGSQNSGDHLSIISMKINSMSPDSVGFILRDSFNIITRTGLLCAPLIHRCIDTYPDGALRISLSYFNKEEEIDYFIDSLNKICKEV
jgi:cysteine desulfurase family protein